MHQLWIGGCMAIRFTVPGFPDVISAGCVGEHDACAPAGVDTTARYSRYSVLVRPGAWTSVNDNMNVRCLPPVPGVTCGCVCCPAGAVLLPANALGAPIAAATPATTARRKKMTGRKPIPREGIAPRRRMLQSARRLGLAPNRGIGVACDPSRRRRRNTTVMVGSAEAAIGALPAPLPELDRSREQARD